MALSEAASTSSALSAVTVASDGSGESKPAPAIAISAGSKLPPAKAPRSTRLAPHTQLINSPYPALSLVADTRSFTISLWLNLQSMLKSGEQTILRLSFPAIDPAAPALTWRIFVSRDHALQLSLTGGSEPTVGSAASPAAALSPSMWHLITLVTRPAFAGGKFQLFSSTWPLASSLLHAPQGSDKLVAVGSELRAIAGSNVHSFDWLKGSLAIGGGSAAMDVLGLTVLTRALTPKERSALINSYSPIGN